MTTTNQRAVEELLPCPFCGGAASVIEDAGTSEKYHGPHFIVRCPSIVGEHITSCLGNFTNLWDSSPEDAATRWNRRAPGWRPISEAPEIGQLVAVHAPGAVLADVWPARWSGQFFDAGGGWFEQDEVTGWYPLPPPPGEG
jgi:hypothetical protein